MDYLKLSEKVISLFFEDYNFNLIGKISWNPVSDREKEKYFNKTGKEKTRQRIRYSKEEELKTKSISKEKNTSKYLSFQNFYISKIEKDNIFYCVIDVCNYRMGQKNRYKFKIMNHEKKIDLSNIKIDMIDRYQLMIR